MSHNQVMTFEEVALRMSTPAKKVSRQSVYLWAHRGVRLRTPNNRSKRGPCVKLRTIRYPSGLRVTQHDLDAFLRALQGDNALPEPQVVGEDHNPLDQIVG